MKPLYLCGLDSIPVWILREFENERGFETLHKFFRKGKIVDLETTLPPVTNSAWTTIYTGLKPGQHGIYDFLKIDAHYNIELQYYNPKLVPPFWEKLAKNGLECLLITPIIVTSLPEERKNVSIITGFPLFYKSNNSELKKLMKEYDLHEEPHIETKLMSHQINLDTAAKMLRNEVRKKAEITKRMLEKHGDYDFVFVCFTETDKIQHFALSLPNWKDYVRPILLAAFQFIEYLINRAEKRGGEVMLVSDHGGRSCSYGFLVNNWLTRNGYLTLKEDFVKTGIEEIKKVEKDAYVSDFLRRNFYANMPLSLRGITYSKAYNKILSMAAGSSLDLNLDNVNISETKAFSTIVNNIVGPIWLNDGRFVSGILSEKEKKKVKNKLMTELQKIKALDGSKLIVNVWDGEKYYGKPKAFIAPDIMFEVKEDYTAILNKVSLQSDFIKLGSDRGGVHTRYGIFGMYPYDKRLNLKGMKSLAIYKMVLNHFEHGT